MKLSDLKPNIRNPRKITQSQRNALKKSLAEFGDLGGVVFNRRLKRLVGAHQRTSVIPAEAKITLLTKYKEPTKAGTVAEGFIEWEGERYAYREVDWDEQREVTAMLAANKHGGSWDDDLLNLLKADFPAMNMELAGFEMPTIAAPVIDIPAPTFSDPSESVTEATEESDEEYVKNTPQTQEQIPTESISTASPFQSINETTEIVGKRHVIIIDCPNAGAKEELKKKFAVEVEMAGAKFF